MISTAGASARRHERTDLVLVLLLAAFVFTFAGGRLNLLTEGATTESRLSLLHITGAALFLAWSWSAIRQRDLRAPDTILWLAGFVATEFLAAIVAGELRTSIVYFARYYPPLLLFVVLLVNVCRRERDLRLVAWSVVVSLTLVAAWMLLALVPGIPGIDPVGSLQGYDGGTVVRAGSVLSSSTGTSFMLAIALGFALLLGRRERWPLRIVAIACVGLLSAGIFLTLSITGVLTAVAILALTGMSMTRRWTSPWSRQRRLAAFLVVGALVVAPALAFEPLRVRIADQLERFYTQPHTTWFSGRVGHWEAAVGVISQAPILGAGPGVFHFVLGPAVSAVHGHVAEFSMVDGREYARAHSTPLTAAGEAGLVGLAFLVAAFVVSGRALHAARMRARELGDRPLQIWGDGLWALFVGSTIALFFHHFLVIKYVWLLLAINAAYVQLVSPREDGVRSRILRWRAGMERLVERSREPRNALLIAGGLVVAVLLARLVGDLRGLMAISLAVAVAVAFLRPDRMLLLFLAVLPTSLVLRFDAFGVAEVPLINSAVQLVGLALIASWAFSCVVEWRRPRIPPASWLLGGFLALELVSTAANARQEIGVTFLARYYLPLALLVVIVYDVVRTRALLRIAFWTIVLSLAVATLPNFLDQLGLVELDFDRASATRTGSIHGGVASTGYHLTLGLLLVPALFLLGRSRVERATAIACGLVLVAGHWYPKSVSALAALAAGLAVWALAVGRARGARVIRGAAVAGSMFALLLIIVATRAPDVEDDLSGSGSAAFLSGREATWSAGFEHAIAHPFLGTGAGSVGYHVPLIVLRENPEYIVREKGGDLFLEPHNSYLQVAGEAGWAAAAAFVGVIIVCLAGLARALRAADETSRPLTVALLAAVVGSALFLMTSDQLVDRYLWVLIGLGLAAGARETGAA